MLGTCLGVFDGYARALQITGKLVFEKKDKDIKEAKESEPNRKRYIISLVFIGVIAFMVAHFFGKQFKSLVDLATTISFIIAPLIAVANYRLVSKKYIDKEKTPPLYMHVLSVLGIIFLTVFAIIYINYL